MIRIIQRLKKRIFYNYLDKLGFGETTGIELADEKPGFVDKEGSATFSEARFLNNSYGQGLQTTSLQMGLAYSAVVNGGFLYKPTVVKKVCNDEYCEEKTPTPIRRVFTQQTSDDIRYALSRIVNQGQPTLDIQPEGYSLGGKTGTSQLAFKGRYQKGRGWTMAGFVGVVSADFPEYVVVVMAWRPRSCEYASCTSIHTYKEVADFLIDYGGIES